jgi:hypothetical protein
MGISSKQRQSKKEDKMKEKLVDRIAPYWGKMSYAEIANIVGSTAEAVRKTGSKAKFKPYRVNSQNQTLTPEQQIAKDVKVESLSRKEQMTNSKYKLVREDNETLKAMLEAARVIEDANVYTLKSKPSMGGQGATAVAVLSDVHFEETVHSQNVNGLNEYNPEIAKQRLEKFFINVVRLIHITGKDSKIESLVLALLGDLINGQLREEAMENNSMRPMDALLQVWRIIASGINYVLDNTSVNLIIPCHSGNHARTTKKIHISTEAGNSLEYVLYNGLASEFKDNKRVKFMIPTSYHSYLDVHGFIIRFSHGHSIRYAGGVGGIFIPVKKALAQFNKARHADLDVIAHFHQMRDGGDFICNGSLIGWNEFAGFIKADFERPKQVFFLIDHKRKEKTVTCPIFVD